jgi:hypothetical protein
MDTQVKQEFGTLVPVLGADGRCCGHLIRGRGGEWRAFDVDDGELGTYPDAKAAVTALYGLEPVEAT